VELMGSEQWTKEVNANRGGDPFSTRQVHRPPWLTALAAKLGIIEHDIQKPLNAVNATGRAYLESMENSPFVLQQIMPLVIFFGKIPSALVYALKRIALAVSSMGVLTSQVLGLFFLVALLLLFLALDTGFECCRRESEKNAETSKRDDWWRQLTSWEANPGGEYIETDFNHG